MWFFLGAQWLSSVQSDFKTIEKVIWSIRSKLCWWLWFIWFLPASKESKQLHPSILSLLRNVHPLSDLAQFDKIAFSFRTTNESLRLQKLQQAVLISKSWGWQNLLLLCSSGFFLLHILIERRGCSWRFKKRWEF